MAASVNNRSRGSVSCLFGSAVLYPVVQKHGERPINEQPLTLLFTEQNNVCSYQSVGVEGAQRICVPGPCFNGEMRERTDGAACWILVFVMWEFKGPDELLHSSPLTS